MLSCLLSRSYRWSNGSYTSLDAASTVYYLYDNDAGVKAFPDDVSAFHFSSSRSSSALLPSSSSFAFPCITRPIPDLLGSTCSVIISQSQTDRYIRLQPANSTYAQFQRGIEP